jgi:hypothetical protein
VELKIGWNWGLGKGLFGNGTEGWETGEKSWGLRPYCDSRERMDVDRPKERSLWPRQKWTELGSHSLLLRMPNRRKSTSFLSKNWDLIGEWRDSLLVIKSEVLQCNIKWTSMVWSHKDMLVLCFEWAHASRSCSKSFFCSHVELPCVQYIFLYFAILFYFIPYECLAEKSLVKRPSSFAYFLGSHGMRPFGLFSWSYLGLVTLCVHIL